MWICPYPSTKKFHLKKVNQQLRAGYIRAQQTWQENPFTVRYCKKMQKVPYAYGKSAPNQGFYADVQFSFRRKDPSHLSAARGTGRLPSRAVNQVPED